MKDRRAQREPYLEVRYHVDHVCCFEIIIKGENIHCYQWHIDLYEYIFEAATGDIKSILMWDASKCMSTSMVRNWCVNLLTKYMSLLKETERKK